MINRRELLRNFGLMVGAAVVAPTVARFGEVDKSDVATFNPIIMPPNNPGLTDGHLYINGNDVGLILNMTSETERQSIDVTSLFDASPKILPHRNKLKFEIYSDGFVYDLISRYFLDGKTLEMVININGIALGLMGFITSFALDMGSSVAADIVRFSVTQVDEGVVYG